MKKNISLQSISNIISEYASRDGAVYELQEGTLGYGLTVCTLNGYKSAVIREFYINPWSCGHTCRFYNILPKKYQDMIDAHEWANVKPVWE